MFGQTHTPASQYTPIHDGWYFGSQAHPSVAPGATHKSCVAVHVYNDERPHEALEQKPPAKAYSCSPRTMPSTPSSPEYPDGYVVRRLTDTGKLCFGANRVHVTNLLAREPVGILAVDEDTWELYYGTVLLAELTMKSKNLHIEKLR